MSDIFVFVILTLSSLGIIAGIILYLVAQKFKVIEDPKIDIVEGVLPSANCGACGYPGCRHFAEACVAASDLSNLFCPVGGNECMIEVAKTLGLKAVEKAPKVAILRCNGSDENCHKTTHYDSVLTCKISTSLYSGQTACQYGCLGFGDCLNACSFDAISIDKKTGLPVINDDKCTSCGACVTACPKALIELRKKWPRQRKIFVACRNHDKGGIAKKICTVACIGCRLCVKECKFSAIEMDNFLAFIDSEKCTLCRKCVSVCPTGAIKELNFPIKKINPHTSIDKKIIDTEKDINQKK